MTEIDIEDMEVSRHLRILAWLEKTGAKCTITNKRSGYSVWTTVFKFELSEDAAAFKLIFDV